MARGRVYCREPISRASLDIDIDTIGQLSRGVAIRNNTRQIEIDNKGLPRFLHYHGDWKGFLAIRPWIQKIMKNRGPGMLLDSEKNYSRKHSDQIISNPFPVYNSQN